MCCRVSEIKSARRWSVKAKYVLGLSAMALTMLAVSAVSASQLVYRPTDPAFGGDPNNGSWLLSQANAQSADAGGGAGSGFTIDFPDFGGITQPTNTTGTDLPDVNGTSNGNN
jgi:hypothetical protein